MKGPIANLNLMIYKYLDAPLAYSETLARSFSINGVDPEVMARRSLSRERKIMAIRTLKRWALTTLRHEKTTQTALFSM